jgi:hypothetical protein
MWKWIAATWQNDDIATVSALKMQWFKKNRLEDIKHFCFFCERTLDDEGQICCDICPAVLINKRFHCTNITYGWSTRPKQFYAKLLHLNKKRKGK